MKKYFNTLCSVFFAIILFFGLGFIFSGKTNSYKNTSADEDILPSYFSASVYQKNGDDEPVQTGSQITQNKTVLLDQNQILKITLGDPSFNNQYAISAFPTIVTVDDITKPNKDYIKPNTQIEAVKDANYVDITLNPYSSVDADSEGKYTVYFSYMEYSGNEYSVSTRKSFSFTFFLFKTSSYMVANLPAVSVSNVETTVAGSSAQYARTHQFHYTNTTISSRLNLPTIVFDYTKFELQISKSVYNLNSETYISLDANKNLVQTGDIVKIFQDKSLHQAIVTFNDIGNYRIEYKYIHYVDSQKYNLSELTNKTKFDRLNIFGVQLYHSDINNTASDKKEFKIFDDSNLLVPGKQTDITFSNFGEEYITLLPNGNYTVSDIPSNFDISFQKDKFNLIPSTNQAPVELAYNATIKKDKSYFFVFENQSDSWVKTENYNGTAFTEVGTYLLKTVYTSTNAIDSTKEYEQWFLFKIENSTPSFTIKDQNDVILASNSWTKNNVYVNLNNGNNPFNSKIELAVYSKNFGEALYSSPVVVGCEPVLFDQNKNYKIVASFGKNLKKQIISYFSIDNTPITGVTARVASNFGGGFVKTKAADFFSNQNIVIEWNEKADKTNITKAFYKYIPLSNTQTSWTTPLLESYYVQGKYIPVDYLLETQNNNFVEIGYQNNVSNTFVSTENILTENGMYIFYIQDMAGNYVYQSFVIDKTSPVILQKISESNTYITDFTALNITSENSTILWGKYKVVKFDIDTKYFNTTSWEPKNPSTKPLDPWLQQILVQNANMQTMANDDDCNFKTITTNSQENLYLASKIDTQNITVQINSKNYNIANANINGGYKIDDYSYQIDIVKDEILYEDTYSFYVSDESNLSDQYQSVYSLQVSTDISKTAVTFKEDDKYNNLEKHNYEISDSDSSEKTIHYYPINLNSTTYTQQFLQLQYLISPTLNTIELESVQIQFYPYLTDYLIYSPDDSSLQNDQRNIKINKHDFYTLDEELQYIGQSTSDFTQYEKYSLAVLIEKGILKKQNFVKGKSYTLAKAPQTTVVYDYEAGINLGILQTNGLYIHDINKVYDSQNEKYFSQEGKYIITRKYRNLGSQTTELVGSKYDFMTRNLVFFVDRQNIISSPESITNGQQSQLVSRIGGEMYLEVLSGSENAKQFKYLYRANSFSDDSITYLLETNMLPVKLYIPLYKLGQIVGETLVTDNRVLFFDDNYQSYIDSNQLNTTITNTATGETIKSDVSFTIQDTKPSNSEVYTMYGNKYFVWKGIDKSDKMMLALSEFSNVGEWKIQISQNNQYLKGFKPVLTFYIKIESEVPQFDILNSTGNELVYFENFYWTNDNKLRVQWTDSSNEFMAKIDKTDINCYANNNFFYKPTLEKITTASNGKTHYFDLDISSLSHDSTVMISMHYEGEEHYYPANSWRVTKQIKIDKIAPVESVDKMILFANEPSLINTVSVRDGHGQSNKYNKTSNEGLFKNFAFVVDKSQFEELIWSSSDKNTIYFRQVPNKYLDSTISELDPQSSDALAQLVYNGQYTPLSKLEDVFGRTNQTGWQTNTYYEIVELDFAQNITVYTIYYTDIAAANIEDAQNHNFEIISYEDGISNYSFYASDVAKTNYSFLVTAKDWFVLKNLNFYNYKWSILTFGAQKYVFSPFGLGNAQVYKYSLNQTTKVDLQNEFNLLPMTANYILTASNVPCKNVNIAVSVTNKDLLLTHPTRENAYFEITSQQITNTTNLDWQYIEVWEYINNKPNKYAKYEYGNNEPIDYLNPESFDIAKISTSNNKTLFEIKSPYAGAQYRYKVTDNFGAIYVFQHLYGQEYIEEINNYDGLSSPLTFNFEDTETYLSNKKMTYNYYYGVTTVAVQAIEYETNGSIKYNKTFDIDPTIPNTYDGMLSVITNGSYASITLNPVDNSDAINGYFGGIRHFIISSRTTIEVVDDNDPSKNIYETSTNNFIIYNLTPQINLKGKNRQNLNGLFDSGDNITSDPVTIEFADTSQMLFPCKVELVSPDGSTKEIQSGETVTTVGTYQLRLSWTDIFSIYRSEDYQFRISSDAWQYYVIEVLGNDGLYHEIQPTASPYSSNNNISYNTHYIVNTTNYKIRTNQTQLIGYSTPTIDTKAGITTYIYEISNYDKSQEFLNYFKTTIAITVVPQSSKLVNDFYYLDTEGNRINFEFSQANYVISKDFENSDYVIVAWNPYYKIEENLISAQILYGESNQPIKYENISLDKNIFQIKLTRSGAYVFRFSDLAGNVQLFDYNAQITNSTSAFEFIFLDNVVFTVNDESPIQYAIYNTDVEIKIPQYTIGYYDNSAKPAILVLRNGKEYTDYKVSSSERKWTFSEPGLYEVTWSAKKDTKEIRQEKFVFQIIRANELVWAFNIESYEGYYIKQILKNGTDVTERMVQQKLGDLKLVQVEKQNEQPTQKYFLTNLFISLYDELTGSGNYTVTIATGNELGQEFTYSFRVNNANPPINISLEEGKSTTKEIVVTFNAYNLYQEVGECIVKISGKEDLVFDDAYFKNGAYQELYEIELTAARDYFIQILTPSERLLFTYKVTRNQPLNTVAIILIVVSSIVVVAGVVIFVLLRKRMKIR